MALSVAGSKEALLEKLLADVSEQRPEQEQQALAMFRDRYCLLDTARDLEQENLSDLTGSLLSFWHFIQQHDPAAPKITVFNPDYEHYGWHSTHTVIQLVHIDQPFIVDSIRMKLNERGLTIHRLRNGIMNFRRDDDHNMLYEADSKQPEVREAFVYLEIDRIEESDGLKQLQQQLVAVLADVRRVVDDHQAMRDQVNKLIAVLNDDEQEEREFLDWLLRDNFTFLACEELKVKGQGNNRQIVRPARSLLGLLRPVIGGELDQQQLEPVLDSDFFSCKERLSFSRAAARSSVHRPAYPEFIVMRHFDENGEVTGESRIMGLYTSPVYQQSPGKIPYVRNKIASITAAAGLEPGSHHAKDLVQILEVFPREELFQMSPEELFATTQGILQIQERHQIKVFLRQDRNGLFCSALAYVPRDIYSTGLRRKMQQILIERLNALDSEFTTYFSESILCRVHFTLRLDPEQQTEFDLDAINEEIIQAARSWEDEFKANLLEARGEASANRLWQIYSDGFTAAYKESFSPQSAVVDVDYLDELSDDRPLTMSFYQSLGDPRHCIRFKVYHHSTPLPLADQIPIIENLGLKVISEYPYKIDRQDSSSIWIHDFVLEYSHDAGIDARRVNQIFRDAFENIWFGTAENDAFNRLVLAAGFSWRQVSILRAYARYMKQIRFGFSQAYIANTLFNNIAITRKLMEMFENRFNPELLLTAEQRLAHQQQLQLELMEALDDVSVLSEDRILRRIEDLIRATLRTNYYCLDADNQPKPYLSLKFAPELIPDLPKPAPRFEIFVYSPRVEGVHLRGGKVARGGLRWSDRPEDFRTEVLGLVKAQQVKNAVIVPVGAKGGFVAKRLPEGDRDAFMKEGISCYRTFIRGLLDLTDNLRDGEVVHPENVIFYDEQDTYLVVAADKGTATFSDIANEIAAEYGFWLDDAFASGGSAGYDHKKMGITAKGAWVSVQRHFRECGVDVQQDRVTAVGVGDMAGDVFGNGMLQSQSLALVGAFNHQHIFIDPNPDTEAAWTERKRLFELPRSSWSDYNSELISEGGGIFSRNAKSIALTDEIRQCLGITTYKLTPSELITAILQAPVDLFWNGGIGTYIKSEQEQHADVGDKANDNLRINGAQLRCKVVGEGGNLGMTQLGRVEYALSGGALNTDFIDNAGGVDCSDHEVNIKVLLNEVVANGDMTRKQRDELLEAMTDEVSQLVLGNNYRQAQAITMALDDAARGMEDAIRFIEQLESEGKLDRVIEFLPDNDGLKERFLQQKTLTRPELSLLVSYAKGDLKQQLINSDIADDAYVAREVETAFPQTLVSQFKPLIDNHRLRREIVATQISNHLINMMGFTYLQQMQRTTGASVEEIARAFVISRDVFGVESVWEQIEALDGQVDSSLQLEMMLQLAKQVRRSSRWFIRHRQDQDSETCVSHFKPRVEEFRQQCEQRLPEVLISRVNEDVERYKAEGVPESLAKQVAASRYQLNALSVIEIADHTDQPLESVAELYFGIDSYLQLHWFIQELGQIEDDNHWQVLARDSIRDELYWQQRALTMALIAQPDYPDSTAEKLLQWLESHQVQVMRWQDMMTELSASKSRELAMFTVAIRELVELVQLTVK
ncbi:NAD-glutamate dehydrogenase [Endozoicomonadaceae bacterium StTr2]